MKVGLLRLNSGLLKLLQQSSADQLATSSVPVRLGSDPEGRVRQPISDTIVFTYLNLKTLHPTHGQFELFHVKG